MSCQKVSPERTKSSAFSLVSMTTAITVITSIVKTKVPINFFNIYPSRSLNIICTLMFDLSVGMAFGHLSPQMYGKTPPLAYHSGTVPGNPELKPVQDDHNQHAINS